MAPLAPMTILDRQGDDPGSPGRRSWIARATILDRPGGPGGPGDPGGPGPINLQPLQGLKQPRIFGLFGLSPPAQSTSNPYRD